MHPPRATDPLSLNKVAIGRNNSRDNERRFRSALRLSPGDFASLHGLGLIRLHQDRLAEAHLLLRRALSANPESADAHNDLGIVLARQGRFADAVGAYEQALALSPQYVAAYRNLANALAALGRNDEAIAYLKTVIELAPDRAESHNDLGVVFVTLERHADAIPHFARALALNPQFDEATNNIAYALVAVRRHDEAIGYFRNIVTQGPTTPALFCGLGYALLMSNQAGAAMDSYRQALNLDPRYAEGHFGCGLVEQALGRLPDARTSFETAVELAPQSPAHHRALAEVKQFAADDPQLAAMEALDANRTTLAAGQQLELHFALGKAYQDLGRHDLALSHLLDGNAIKRRGERYDEDATLTMFRHIESVFTAELLRDCDGRGDPSDAPIFILGMPRSGSTLIEQILASHSQVFGAGELHYLADAARAFRGGDISAFFPEIATTMTGDAWRRFGARYIEQLRAHAPDAARITDKMPANFRFIGLIRMALPNARIIHTRRDPVDTCLSCFSHLFAGAQEFAYDLGELGRYYRGYDRLMAHWRRVLPDGAMLEIQYEDLIADFDHEARRIVAYCGLPWEDRCRDFHRTERLVRTASAAQVRQPLYASAIGRWKPYEKMLRPLLDELHAAQAPHDTKTPELSGASQ